MAIAVFGAGLVGRRTAEKLVASGSTDVRLISQRRPVAPLDGVTTSVGWSLEQFRDVEAVVLATESKVQVGLAQQLIGQGIHVVTTADDPLHVRRLWGLGDMAREHGAALVVGASYSPGVSTLLAACLVRSFDSVSTIRTAQFGTGGPACAREHHRAMGSTAREVRAGLLRDRRGGSGRELVWFPDPVGAADCYRAGLSEPFLLHQAFPSVRRIESRQAATRRDRLSSRLPMLRRPHAEGLLGAVWAEVRGEIDGRVEHRSLAATAPQASGAAAMAASLCREVVGEGKRLGASSAACFDNSVFY